MEKVEDLIKAVRSVVTFSHESNNFCTDLERIQKVMFSYFFSLHKHLKYL